MNTQTARVVGINIPSISPRLANRVNMGSRSTIAGADECPIRTITASFTATAEAHG